MNQLLLIKDICLMLKDLKFQIFFLLLLVLFILSAISSSVVFSDIQEEFQTDQINHNDRIHDGRTTILINMLSRENILQIISSPSPAILFSNFDSYPDKISTDVMFYDPTFLYYGTATTDVFRLNWYLILGIMAGFIMLVLSFEAISYEKRGGTLKLITVYNIKRQSVLWYKFISYTLLYLFVIIPPALISMTLFFSLTGTWSISYMLKYLLILLLSIPFASFFIWLGIYISMTKNYRNAIVLVVFLWLLFVIIIPQSSNIIAKQLSTLKTNVEYNDMGQKAWWDEFNVWIERHGASAGGNVSLHDRIRADASNAADEKVNQIKQQVIADSYRQTLIKRSIANISPFVQLEHIAEIIFNKGFYLLNFQQETAKSSINQIRNLMIAQDANDETSINLFYSMALSDADALSQFGQTPFSTQLFEHPDLLFVTDIQTDDALNKTMKILLRLLPIICLNLFLIVGSVIKLEKLDIR